MKFTRTGDKGYTSLFGGKRVPKTSPVMHALGTIDELNSAIGMARAFSTSKKIQKVLEKVQHELFNAQAQLAKADTVAIALPSIEQHHIDALEKVINSFDKKLLKQTEFILPGGNKQAATLHLARTICRRAERITWGVTTNRIPQYLNRLSLLLFILARVSGKDEGVHYG